MNRTVTLNGREYPLRFTVNSLCCLEEKTGQSLTALQSSQFTCLRALLWCGLLSFAPDMTLEAAGDLMDAHLQAGGDLGAVSAQLAGALEDACFFRTGAAVRKQPAPAPSGSVSCI